MRFKTHKPGDTRIRKVFLWFPDEAWINETDRETRWLETAYLRQYYTNVGVWETNCFLTEAEYNEIKNIKPIIKKVY